MAQSAALAKSRNCGQVCVSPQRFIVHEKIYDTFCTLTAKHLAEFKIGNGAEPTTQLGPLINAKQRDGIAKLIERVNHDAASKSMSLPEGSGICLLRTMWAMSSAVVCNPCRVELTHRS